MALGLFAERVLNKPNMRKRFLVLKISSQKNPSRLITACVFHLILEKVFSILLAEPLVWRCCCGYLFFSSGWRYGTNGNPGLRRQPN